MADERRAEKCGRLTKWCSEHTMVHRFRCRKVEASPPARSAENLMPRGPGNPREYMCIDSIEYRELWLKTARSLS